MRESENSKNLALHHLIQDNRYAITISLRPMKLFNVRIAILITAIVSVNLVVPPAKLYINAMIVKNLLIILSAIDHFKVGSKFKIRKTFSLGLIFPDFVLSIFRILLA